jgi:hypothetical protein
MPRVGVVIGVIVLILLTSGLVFSRYPSISIQIQDFFPKKQNVSVVERYSAKSEVAEYSLELLDTAYFDYTLEKMGLFRENAIVDPRIYRGFPELDLRYTAKSVKFVLVPKIDQFLMAISGKDDFAGRGDYSIEDEVLVVKVSLNFNELSSRIFLGSLSAEDAFVQTAIQTAYYAQGLSDGKTNVQAFGNIRDDMKTYLYSGIMSWPIAVKKI